MATGSRTWRTWSVGEPAGLGDEHRLGIIDLLWSGDRTPAELQDATGLRSNLVAFHLNTLQDAGLISRHASHGDGRRRYVTLTTAALPHVGPVAHWHSTACCSCAPTTPRDPSWPRRCGDTARAVDAKVHTLTVREPDGGAAAIGYDQLIIGTGVVSARPPTDWISTVSTLEPVFAVHADITAATVY